MKRPLLVLLSLFLLPPAHARDDGIESLRQTGKAFAAVARQVSPSVVFIQVEEKRQATQESGDGGFLFGDDLFLRFFGDDFPWASTITRISSRPTRPSTRAIRAGHCSISTARWWA